MVRLLASLLVAMTLFFSPLAMKIGDGTAMAHMPVVQMEGGCADMHPSSPDDQKSDVKMNCAMACAAIPGASARLGVHAAPSTTAGQALPPQMLAGIWPERETPPPRTFPEI